MGEPGGGQSRCCTPKTHGGGTGWLNLPPTYILPLPPIFPDAPRPKVQGVTPMGPAVAAPPSPKGMPVEMPGTQGAAAWGFKGWKRGFGATIPSPGQPVWESSVGVVVVLPSTGVWCCAGSLLEDPLSPTGSLALRGSLTALLPHRPLPMVLEVPVQPRVIKSKPPGLGWKLIYLSWGLGVVFPKSNFPKFGSQIQNFQNSVT